MAEKKLIIGFIGTGVMGKSMARNLMNNNYDLIVYTRTKEKASQLIENGAKWEPTVADLAKKADVVITMVGYPEDVEQIYFSKDGLIENCKKGSYLIDMTTSQPSLAEKIYDEAKKRGINALDCPVSGGDIGARDGKLSIMVGGDKDDFNHIKPILGAMGTNIVYHGRAGTGQHAKMCNQIVVATAMIGVSEAVVYAEKSGLQLESVLQSITSGAANSWLLENLAPKMVEGDFEPGFYIKHFIKDMGIAILEAEKMEMEIPGVQLAKQLYEKIANEGEENSGTQALYKYWK